MRKRNKFLALLLAATLSLSVGACSSTDNASSKSASDAKTPAQETGQDKPDAVEALATAQKNIDTIKSLNAKMVMEMDMDMEADGESQSFQTVTNMDMACFYDPVKLKMDMTMDAGEAGTSSMEIYAEADENGKYTMYMYDGANWQTQTVELAAVEQYDAANNMAGYMQDSYNFKEAGTEQVDGVTAYKYTGAITGGDMKEAILSSGALNSLSSLGIDSTQIESMMDGLSEIPITLWVDETGLYPLKYELDMTAVMDTLISNMLQTMGDQSSGYSMNISKMKISMTCSDFNAATEFSIPEEAKGTEPAAS